MIGRLQNKEIGTEFWQLKHRKFFGIWIDKSNRNDSDYFGIGIVNFGESCNQKHRVNRKCSLRFQNRILEIEVFGIEQRNRKLISEMVIGTDIIIGTIPIGFKCNRNLFRNSEIGSFLCGNQHHKSKTEIGTDISIRKINSAHQNYYFFKGFSDFDFLKSNKRVHFQINWRRRLVYNFSPHCLKNLAALNPFQNCLQFLGF